MVILRNMELKKIIFQLEKGNFTREELLFLLQMDHAEPLFLSAEKIRDEKVGKEIHLRGIIEFSNKCNQDCLYCGVRASNTKVKRFSIEVDEIISIASKAISSGLKTVVLQSGCSHGYEINKLCEIVRGIRKAGAVVTLSLGEMDRTSLGKLKFAGAQRYLLKHETCDENLYRFLKPRRELSERIECHRILKDLDYQVGSGIMIGLPDQTIESIAEDLILFHRMNYDMLGIGPFIPHRDTPLNKAAPETSELVLRVIAISRLLLKTIHIPATSAFLLNNPINGLLRAFRAGANVLMCNLTPEQYHQDYSIYPGRKKNALTVGEIMRQSKTQIENCGYTLSSGYGHRIK